MPGVYHRGMHTQLHRAHDRGKGEYGWLSTRYSFSFANWYDPSRMGFGKLRVINDDVVAPAHGFDLHRHQDMEIITIVTKGAVTHEDSMGNKGAVPAGDVQVMSAGTGVTHAEYNDSKTEALELFQIWIESDAEGHAPRYDQKSFGPDAPEMLLLVSPDGRDGSLMIHQDAFLWRGTLARGATLPYTLRDPAHGVYLFVIGGTIEAADAKLGARDALGVTGTETVTLASHDESSFLLIEVPL